MKTVKIFVISLLYTVIIQQGLIASGTTGAQFLKIGVGARACAMGEAFTGLADDPSCVFWNPSGLTQTNSYEFLLMQNFWLLDMSYQYLAGVLPTKYGNVGIAVSYSSSGDIPKYEDFRKVGEYSAYDAAGTIAFASNIKQSLSYGIGLKVIHQKIEDETANGIAVDLGLIYQTPWIRGIQLGVAMHNLGPEIKFISESDPLPLGFRGGVAYKKDVYTLTLDMNKYLDEDIGINFGGEYWIKNIFAIRAGYNSLNSYSAGFGLYWKGISFDYAFVPINDLEPSSRISLRFNLKE